MDSTEALAARTSRRGGPGVGVLPSGRRGAQRHLHPRLPRQRRRARADARDRVRAHRLPRGRAPPQNRRRDGDGRRAGRPLVARRRPRQPDRGALPRRRRARRLGRRRTGARPRRLRGAVPQRREYRGRPRQRAARRRARRWPSLAARRRAPISTALLAEGERRVRDAIAPLAADVEGGDGEPACKATRAPSARLLQAPSAAVELRRRPRLRDRAGVCSRSAASTPSSTGRAASSRRTPPTSSSRSPSSSRRTPPSPTSWRRPPDDGTGDHSALPRERRAEGRRRSLPQAVPRAAQGGKPTSPRARRS